MVQTERHYREVQNPDMFVAPPIQARELVTAQFSEPAGLTLLRAPIHVVRINSDSPQTEYMACIDRALTRSTFEPFLEGAAPYKCSNRYGQRSFAIDGVIADWRLPDLHGEGSDRLNEMHSQALGQHWQVFRASRELFMNTLTTPDVLPKHIGDSPDRPLRSFNEITADFLTKGVFMGSHDIREFFRRPEFADVREAIADIIKSMPKAEKSRRMKSANSETVLDQFSNFGQKNRVKYLRRLMHGADENVRNRIIQEYSAYAFDALVLPLLDDEEPKTWYVKKAGAVEGVYDDVDRVWKTHLVYDTYSLEATAVRMGNGSVRYVVLDHDTLRRKYFVKPLLHWRKSENGERTWDFDFLSRNQLPSQISELVDKDTLSEEDRDPRLNPLAGLISIAYFSPDIVKQWPAQVGLPGGRYSQTMGPAQVPVLAMMRSNDLLNSEFLANLELYADIATKTA